MNKDKADINIPYPNIESNDKAAACIAFQASKSEIAQAMILWARMQKHRDVLFSVHPYMEKSMVHIAINDLSIFPSFASFEEALSWVKEESVKYTEEYVYV